MKQKLSAILLSAVIAFGLWYYTISVVSPGSEEVFTDIPVVLEGESALDERGLMVTATGKTNVTLRLSGNRSDLNELNRSNITIKANLATIYDPGENIQLTYNIFYPGNVANNAFVEESRSPGYITVTVEKRDYKDVPVNVVYTGAVPEGFTTKNEEETLDYSQIRISGPESVVDTIAQAKIEVSLTDQTETIDQSFKFTLCDKAGEPVDAQQITVYQQEVHLRLPIQKVKTIPLRVTVVDGAGATEKTTSITIDPLQVQVCGSAAALEELDELVLGSINLADYVSATDLTYDIVLPEGVTNMTGITKATVRLQFPDLSVRTFTITDIQAINVPEGLEVDVTTQVLDIKLRGPSEEIAKITEAAITVTVDFTGTEPGTSSRRVQITIAPEFPNTGALGTYNAYATVHTVEEDTTPQED